MYTQNIMNKKEQKKKKYETGTIPLKIEIASWDRVKSRLITAIFSTLTTIEISKINAQAKSQNK